MMTLKAILEVFLIFKVSKTPRNDAMGKETRINPLELLEKADAIVSKDYDIRTRCFHAALLQR